MHNFIERQQEKLRVFKTYNVGLYKILIKSYANKEKVKLAP